MRWECTNTKSDLAIDDADAEERARALGCRDFFCDNTNSTTAADRADAASCAAHGPFLREPVFSTSYDTAHSARGNATAVTTRVKTNATCRHDIEQRTCRVTPAAMDFVVDFTRDTLELAADVAEPATEAVLLPPPPARSASEQDADAAAWKLIASTLFPPVTVEYQLWWPGNATLRFKNPCDGQDNTTGEKSCRVGLGDLRHLMLPYKNDDEHKNRTCELSYRDPMDVSVA